LKTVWPPSTPPDPDADRPAGALVEFEVLADADSADALSDALLQGGALSVSVEDAEAQSETEQPVYAEPGADGGALWRLNRVRVLLAADRSPEALLAFASHQLERAPPEISQVRRVDERDWVRASREQFAPIRIGRLWIVPSWLEPPDASAVNLRLDPGMAFGTGSHPSTRLCLQWLEACLQPGDSVLDYGCGSGVLAIAASKLGAGRVTGVDIDPLALRTAAENTRRNAVRADYTAPESLPAGGPNGRFDVVVANILANPLMQLAPVLVTRLSRQGSLVLAGVLARQADGLIRAYRAVESRLTLTVWDSEGEWVCLAGRLTGR
jgi:ribosomal protein L11 methyltransferase